VPEVIGLKKRESLDGQATQKKYLRKEKKMERVFEQTAIAGETPAAREMDTNKPSYQAYQILHFGFTVAPIAMGIDKFFNLLVDWDKYLPPFVNNLTGGHGHELMLAVGVIEIVAGLGVWFKPKIFAYVVAAWLLLIIVNLLMIPGYFDVALRDFGLMLGAIALGRLSQKYSN
jgi:hypothetical protein